MIHLGDVTKIDGSAAPLVDVIIGGSPCQDLSVAGKRAGLDGARSGLFMEQIRIIKQMRRRCQDAGANEIRPRYFVWENVPGAFSSNGGEDFRTVLEEICRIVDEGAHVPRPHAGGGGTLWRTSGAIVGDGYSVAWRVLDAQFWGVPQRRRRIALIADFGGATAPEILFVGNSVSGRTETGGTTRQGSSADIEGGAGAAIGFDYLQGSGSRGIGAETERCGTIRIQPHIAVCQKPIGFNYTNSITAKTNPTIDKAEALRASGGGGAAVCYALDRASFNQGINAQYNPSITDDGIIQTIVSKGPGAVCVKDSAEVYDARGNGNGEIVPTITGDHNDRITDYTAVVTQKPTYCLQGNGIDRTEKSGCNGKGVKEGVCYTLNTTDRPAVSDGAEGYIVRRLTPLECERLQGFPDGWTDIGEWVDVKGKTRQTTDAARYKALGNSIAIPPWKWVLKRLCANYERDATMASLFDGIGGFPLIWERLNGAGTCIWASEIEEFPIAVTKKHFQGATV